jgi:ABC-type Zn uptake system ZnuABC Zn-binding protein ZnuA
LGLESWASDVLKKVGNAEAVTVAAGESVPADRLIATRDEDLLKDRASAFVPDPHVWLDPTLAVYEVEAIRDGLIEADPAHADTYRANASSYQEKLEALDARLKAELAPVAGAAFAAAHPSWVYFAPHYGLEQAGNLEELPGREPGLKQIRELVDEAKRLGVRAVVAEPQLSPRAVEELAAELGPDVRVVTIDSLGNPEDTAVDSYMKVMRLAGRSFAEALK